MIIVVPETGAVALANPENFRGFHIASALPASQADAIAGAMAAAGLRLDGDHGWVPVDWLARQGGDFGPAWRADLDGMVAYARQKGWVDEGANAIRAHIEWP